MAKYNDGQDIEMQKSVAENDPLIEEPHGAAGDETSNPQAKSSPSEHLSSDINQHDSLTGDSLPSVLKRQTSQILVSGQPSSLGSSAVKQRHRPWFSVEIPSLPKEDETDSQLPRVHRLAAIGKLDKIDQSHINSLDEVGKTPLHYAITHSQAQVALLLIKKGADFMLCDHEHLTALHILMRNTARRRNKYDIYSKIVDCILEHAVGWFRARRETKDASDEELYPLAVKYIFSSDLSSKYGSVLSYAARCGAYEMIQKVTQLQGVYHRRVSDARYFEADITDFFPVTQRQNCFSEAIAEEYPLLNTAQQSTTIGTNGSQPKLAHSVSMYSKNELQRFKSRFVESMPSLCGDRTDADTEIGKLRAVGDAQEDHRLPRLNGYASDCETREAHYHKHCIKNYSRKTYEKVTTLTQVPSHLGTPMRELERYNRPSHVEYLLCNKERDVHKSLSISHIKRIPSSFWKMYTLPDILMCILHITHMVLLSLAAARFPDNTLFCSTSQYLITASNPINNSNNSSATENYTTTSATPPSPTGHDRDTARDNKPHYGGLVVWPVILMFLDVVYIIRFLYIYYRMGLLKQQLLLLARSSRPRPSIWFLSGAVFHISSVVWVPVWVHKECVQKESLILSLIFGWFYVIHWTQFWKTINHLSLVIHRILFKDVIKFMTIFSVFLIGFTMALRVLLASIAVNIHQTVMHTMFEMFSLAVGMNGPSDIVNMVVEESLLGHNKQNPDGWTQVVGVHPKHFQEQVLGVKLLCVGFIVCVFIILLNMLIAIMNDSYSSVTTEFDQDWERNRIEGIVTSYRLFPWTACILHKITHNFVNRYIKKDEYGCMWMRMERGRDGAAPEDHSVQSLMMEKMEELSKLVKQLSVKIEKMEGASDTGLSTVAEKNEGELDVTHIPTLDSHADVVT